MIGTRGKVMGADGQWRDYHSARLTHQDAKVVRLTFSDGSQVICTPDHRFLTAAGWVAANDLHGAIRHVAMAATVDLPRGLECVSIEPAGRSDVYCLTVPDGSAFALALGAIVHNCDTLPYSIMARPWQAPVLEKSNPVRDRWDRAFAQMTDDYDSNWRTV